MAKISKTSSASSGPSTGRGTPRGTSHGTVRRRFPVAWLLIAVILTAAVSVGAAAFLLPDRHPAILSSAKEVTSAPVGIQRYDANRQISVIPTLSASRQVLINTSGTVTADHSGEGLVSGRAALAVDERPIVALATATPLYRDLKYGDKGRDVRAFNDELARLGFGAPADTDRYTTRTVKAVKALWRGLGVTSTLDGNLAIADVIWLPQREATVFDWNGVPGTMVTAGTPIGRIPGALTAISLRDGAAENADRTITVFGQQGVLKAGATRIDDPEFCARVTASPEFRMFAQSSSSKSAQGQSSGQSSGQSASQESAQGIDATVALTQPLDVMRVPAAAVFGVDGNTGCIASDGRTIPVTVIGADLGVSLVRPADGSEPSAGPSTVQVGGAIRGLTCPRG
ncbi:peptidoglycan-binding domain-containing protein [Bifidobacterium callitrichos]|uniref:Peptidoglycan-binding domain 1 protein n=1 Tax=Bifidobacterium callitrichos DSM 23973 TaxID=1437609 RepID=A0A087ACH0_9BIFI|nr:hypothetical protein [Bifidobacterium callitrichos]KFI56470.1 hypothetical protein BCAL_0063 [Bifidobacterium callitrichos DSM 23973]